MIPQPHPIRILAVHDDPRDMERLLRYLRLQKDVELVADSAENGDILAQIRTYTPDAAFLGFLPGTMDCFEVLEALEEHERPGVVFISAFKDHALRAFDFQAIDYLLTPLTVDRLDLAMKRVRDAVALKARSSNPHLVHLSSIPGPNGSGTANGYLDRLLIRARDRMYLVCTKDIDWVEAAADYVHVYAGGKKHILRAKIGDLEKRLDPMQFARIHRSTIVRIDRIAELRPMYHGDYQVVLGDRTELTLSRGYKGRFSVFLQCAI